MLKTLRWKLTFLYLTIAVGLVILVSVGTYLLIGNYFQKTTDLALQYKMAVEFRSLNLVLPDELAQAEVRWRQNNSQSKTAATAVVSNSESDDSENENENESSNEGEYEDYYDGELAAVYVISMDRQGNPILAANIVLPPMVNDPVILNAALQSSKDLRTVTVRNQGRVRVLSYRTGLANPVLLQTGRLLDDQDRALNQYIVYTAMLGGTITFLLAFISWWLAGRSLGPAQKAWDQQQTFVSNASHELRTPLTLIRASADYSLRCKSSEEQAGLIHDILEECDSMNRLVDDLLLLSRLDAHRLKLTLEPVSVGNLFSQTARQMGKLVEKDQLSLETGSGEGCVLADPNRLQQVLFILVDNAIRFTPAGGTIRLDSHVEGKRMTIQVIDNGKGIDRAHLPHLFERFYQVPAEENEAGRSNGLGLSIAKELIEAQNGSIRIDSGKGSGTTATLMLPRC